MFKRRGNGQCANTMCDIVMHRPPARTIGFVCDQIVTFERHFGQDLKDQVREMLKEAVDRYGPGTPFENDERMLPVYSILGRYSRTIKATDLYKNLNEKKLYLFSAQFYVDWAEVHLLEANFQMAAKISADAIKIFGPEHPRLKELKTTVDRIIAERDAAEQAAAVVAQNAYSYPPPPFVPPSIVGAVIAPSARRLDLGALIVRAPPGGGLPQQLQPQAPPPATGTPTVPQFELRKGPRPRIDLSIVHYSKAVRATAVATAEYHASAAARRVLGPIQAPARGAAAEAAAASLARAAVDAVLGPSADQEDDFPPPRAAVSSSSLAEAPAQPVPQSQPTEDSGDNNDENEKENVAPRKKQQQQQSRKSLLQPMPTSVVLPSVINGPSPIDQDMISPSLAQMKPGRENQFFMPPVYSFEGAARGPNNAQQ